MKKRLWLLAGAAAAVLLVAGLLLAGATGGGAAIAAAHHPLHLVHAGAPGDRQNSEDSDGCDPGPMPSPTPIVS